VTLRILITGSRAWTDRKTIRQALEAVLEQCAGDCFEDISEVTVVHGAARGADRITAEIATELGCTVEAHPADWDRHGKAAGPIRNAEMVRLGADLCLAFPTQRSIGTRHCMQLARAAGISVLCYEAPTQARDGSAA
jgi:hypothetical protein